MDLKQERVAIRKLLAADRHAECPHGLSRKRFAAIRRAMYETYMREWMNTPEGLYSDSEIWQQTFGHLLK